MKVAMLFARSDIVGGTSVIMRNLCSGLEPYGITTTAIAGGEGPFISDLEAHRISWESVPSLGAPISPPHDLRALAQLRKVLRRVDPDLLACHSSKAGVIGRVVARQMGIPAVYTAHGWSFSDGVPGRQAATRLVIERATARLFPSLILNVCEADREMALRHGVGLPEDHLVVCNGIPDVDPAFRADPAAGPPRIVMIARFEDQKDHVTLIRALRILADRQWSAELVGDGERLNDCRRLAIELGLGERISFTGAVTRPQDSLAQGQIFALATNWEGLPLTVLEAMRAGLPVVASDVGGVGEAVEDGVNGFLVPRGGVDEMAEALARLIDDSGLRSSMGAAGRARYEAEFTQERMLAAVAEVYRNLVTPQDSRASA